MKNETLIKNGDATRILLNLFKLQYILMLAYLILYPHRIYFINRTIGYSMIIVNLVSIVYIVAISLAADKVNSTLVTIIGLIFSLLTTSVPIRDQNLAIQTISSYVAFVAFIDVQSLIKADKSLGKFICRITLIASVVFIIYANMPFAYYVESDDIYLSKDSLTLGYSNPNAVAMILMFFLVMTMIFSRSKQLSKPICWVLYVEYSYLIYLTESRAVLIATALLLILNLFTLKKISKWVFWGLVLFSVLNIFLLPYLKEHGQLLKAEILGESIYTGREKLFAQRIKYLSDALHWTFGNIGRGMFDNHHNGLFSILLSAGLFGVITFLKTFTERFFPCMENMNKTSYIAVCGVLMVFMHSTFEASCLIGGLPYGLVLITLLIYAHYEEENQ